MKLSQKAEFFSGLWRTGKNGCLSHTHTDLKEVLTDFEAFKNKISNKTKQILNQHALRILPVFSKLKSKDYRWSYSKKRKNLSPLLCFELFHGTVWADGRTHGDEIRLHFSLRSALKGCLIWPTALRRETKKTPWELGLKTWPWTDSTKWSTFSSRSLFVSITVISRLEARRIPTPLLLYDYTIYFCCIGIIFQSYQYDQYLNLILSRTAV